MPRRLRSNGGYSRGDRSRPHRGEHANESAILESISTRLTLLIAGYARPQRPSPRPGSGHGGSYEFKVVPDTSGAPCLPKDLGDVRTLLDSKSVDAVEPCKSLRTVPGWGQLLRCPLVLEGSIHFIEERTHKLREFGSYLVLLIENTQDLITGFFR
jgi:hypothetical protein